MGDTAKEIVECARNEKWKVCIYGLGYFGKKIADRLSDILHIKIDYYCDGNAENVASFHLPGAAGIEKKTLMGMCEDVLVLILVDYPYDDVIQKELAGNCRLHTVRIRDVAAMDEVAADFYGEDLYRRYQNLEKISEKISEKTCEPIERKETDGLNKIAVYTCITGGYDKLMQPCVVEECCDYYVISDDPDMGGGVFRYVNVDTVVPDCSMSAKDKNRYCKMHPHEIFPKYDFTIYMDGSIRIKNPIAHFINNIGASGLSIHRHKIHDCIYIDGIFAEWLGVVEKEKIIRELKRYMEEGLPRKFGMCECMMIVSDLQNKTGRQLYRKWHEEYQKGAGRDQFSFIYALWKMGLCVNAVGNLCPGGNVWTNPDIIWNRKSHYA
ncbi:MAG: DUF616 domain-containing protein [bacterium]|nr:DUF616 domain-containing protein [bacterium]MCM1423611.1 DUF616 domain-containing protein [bacterium]